MGTTRSEPEFDVLCIGAGPANIAAVAELLESGRPLRLALVDRGSPARKRRCAAMPARGCQSCPSCGVIEGFGGAGMYSDGKLRRTAEPNMMRAIEHLESAGLPPFTAPAGILAVDARLRSVCGSAGLFYFGYLSQHVGTKGIVSVTRNLERRFRERGATLYDGCDVRGVAPSGSGLLEVVGETACGAAFRLRAEKVLIGTGKGGQSTAEALLPGIRVHPNPAAIGVRLEVPRQVMFSLTGGAVLDPQIALSIPGHGHVRTFCTCTGGSVIPYRRDSVLMLGGQANPGGATAFSNVALLCALQGGCPFLEWKRRAHAMDPAKPVVQRLGDFMAGRAPAGRVVTSLKWSQKGPIHEFLPPSAALLVAEMIARLALIDPRLADESNALSAPVFEPRTTLDLPGGAECGVHLVGDLTGRSGGIMDAAAMGVEAARRITVSGPPGRGSR
ncbi:MAG TPA: hypothetical protein VKF41_11535 [Bryobacteraceae bacterium]|nr:hypothetical protein [Bryobacteraceae bacterium]